MTITAVNDAPLAANVTDTIDEDTDYSGTLSGSDADGDALTYAIASNPSNGTVDLSSGNNYLSFDGTDDYFTKSHEDELNEEYDISVCVTKYMFVF